MNLWKMLHHLCKISVRDDDLMMTMYPSPEMNLWKKLHHLYKMQAWKKLHHLYETWKPCIHLQRCELEKNFTISKRLENHVSISRDASLKKASPTLRLENHVSISRDASLKKTSPSLRDLKTMNPSPEIQAWKKLYSPSLRDASLKKLHHL